MKICVCLIPFLAATTFAAEPLALMNMSVRLEVSNTRTPIVGFVISNPSGGADNPAQARLLIRAVGPTLRRFGVGGPASGVEVVPFSGRTVATLRADRALIESTSAAIGAFNIGEGDDAKIIEQPAGAVTIQARPTTSQSGGEALIEIYLLPTIDTAPTGPRGLVVISAIGQRMISLDWDDNPATQRVQKYAIYRADSMNISPERRVKVGESSTSTFTDTAAEVLRRHFYWVTAIDQDGRESAVSNPTSGVANAGV